VQVNQAGLLQAGGAARVSAHGHSQLRSHNKGSGKQIYIYKYPVHCGTGQEKLGGTLTLKCLACRPQLRILWWD